MIEQVRVASQFAGIVGAAMKSTATKAGRHGSAVERASPGVPIGYGAFLEDLKTRIRSAQVRAALSVNRELIQLYWDIGRAVALKQQSHRWGTKVIDRLAADLQREFPGVGGFSRTNIYRMRAFYQAYCEPSRIVSQPARLKRNEIVPQPVGRYAGRIVPQPVGQMERRPIVARAAGRSPDDASILQQPVGELPWGHNVVLLEALKTADERLWYARQALAHGWSRNMLVHWIESDLYSRQGNSVNNFDATLPPDKSDLAREIVKDPYNFDFLTLHADAMERELEEGLLEHITRFLLELGAGFAFVGRQVPLEVDGEDYRLDLLFYHLHLRSFFVIDLKPGPFKPEYAGKMNFYLSAVDDQMRREGDGPSIGLILCKTRSKVIAEYALRHLARPVGVARYVTQLTGRLPQKLAGQLPSVRQIESELSGRGSRKRGTAGK